MEVKTYYKVLVYNVFSVINIIAKIMFVTIILNEWVFNRFYELDANIEEQIELFMVIFILINIFTYPMIKNKTKKFMLKKVQVQAEHNNVKLDFEKDNGSTPLENRAFFPYNIKHYGLCQKMSFDLIKNGEFEDLGFSYSVDKCSCRGTTGYVLGPEYIKSDKMVYAKYGFVSNFVLNKNINETPIIISSKTFDYNECRKN